jgi:hypothetical protein
MREFLVDGIGHEIDDESFELLLANGALEQKLDGTTELNTNHSFTYDEVVLLLNPVDEN